MPIDRTISSGVTRELGQASPFTRRSSRELVRPHFNPIQIAMAIIIRFSVRETNPRGTLL